MMNNANGNIMPDERLSADEQQVVQRVVEAFDRLHLDGIPGDFELTIAQTEALYAAAHQLLGKGDLERARVIFNYLVICEGQDARFWAGLAVVLQKQKQWALAIDAYSMAVTLDATNVRWYFHATECLMQNHEWERARQALEAFVCVCDTVYGNDKSKIRQYLDKAEVWQRIIDAKAPAQ